MLNRLIQILIPLFLLVLVNCVDAQDIKIDTLKNNAIKIKPDYFYPNDEFIFVGKIAIEKDILYIGFNKHYWGENRLTGRIVIFNSKGKYLGTYGSITDTPMIQNNKIIFTEISSNGNVIDFEMGIPEKIWIDGEIYDFEK